MSSEDTPIAGIQERVHSKPVPYLVRYEVMDDDHWTVTTDMIDADIVSMLGSKTITWSNSQTGDTLLVGEDQFVSARTDTDTDEATG